jgi:integrase
MGAPKMEKTRHPGIYKRGGRYVVVWRHRGRQHKSFHRTLAEAREAKGRRAGGDSKPATRQQFDDYARAWLLGYAGRTRRGFTEQSRGDYERALEHYAIPFFAGWRLADVEPPDVRAFIRDLESHKVHTRKCTRSGACACPQLTPASVVKNLTPLKAMFATAVEDGHLRSNATAGLRVNGRRDEAEEEVAKAMTRAELARVLAEVPDDWRLFFELLAKTGLRISEALGLDWKHVQFGATPTLRVRQQCYRGTLKRLKSRNGRRDLPLAPGLARALWAGRPADGAGPVFTTGVGTRYSDRNVRRILDPAAERAGVPWVSFHAFRHTCASMLFEGGKNIRQVCDWLGHADPAFTLRTYVHLMDTGLGGADFLDDSVAPVTLSGESGDDEEATAVPSPDARAVAS